MSELDRDASQALAALLNWEPPNHDGLPGSIPDNGWDHWVRFEKIAGRQVDWLKVDAALWREQRSADWAPEFEALSEGELLLLLQHDWHGFPDPPEWALYVIEGEPVVARCLGCFDVWPEAWREKPMTSLDKFTQKMIAADGPRTPADIAKLLDACVMEACVEFGLGEAEIYCGGQIVTIFLTPRHPWEAVIVGPNAYQLYPGFLRNNGEVIAWANVWVADNYTLEKFVSSLTQEFERAAEDKDIP